jgi:hypothetical protein
VIYSVMCDHLHDTTSRYDAAQKLLTLLLVCRICGTEKVVETLEYEPRPAGTLADWQHRKLPA